MSRAFLIEAFALYLPLCGCFALAMLERPRKAVWVGGLMAFVWQLAVLPWLNLFSMSQGWWSYAESSYRVIGTPVSLYLGWAFCWSFLLVLWQESIWWKTKFKSFGYVLVFLICLIVDMLVMPELSPVVTLSYRWYLGEFLCVGLALLPAQILAYAVTYKTFLVYRAIIIALAFIILILAVLPHAISNSALDEALQVMCKRSWLVKSLTLIALFLFAVPGISALQEFITRGKGTPIPYDAPQKLVKQGVYAYCANPMQLSMFLVLISLGFFFSNWVYFALAVTSIVYSVGFARWSEGLDMQKRFGKSWRVYSKSVPSWRFRFEPAIIYPEAELYLAKQCGVCSEFRNWFEKQGVQRLKLRNAEDYAGASLKRITYSCNGEECSGVRAVAEAFQHINILYAWLGWVMKLPLVSHLLQLTIDLSGGDERVLRRTGR